MSNIIVKNDKIYTLDARNTSGANSYLLDIAKLRMSLNGYERIFGISDVDNSSWCDVLDDFAKEIGFLKEIKALEIMFIFRCFRYKNKEDQKKIIDFALQESAEW